MACAKMTIQGPVLKGIPDVLNDELTAQVTVALLKRALVHLNKTTTHHLLQCWSQRTSYWAMLWVLSGEPIVVEACAHVGVDKALNLVYWDTDVKLVQVFSDAPCL